MVDYSKWDNLVVSDSDEEGSGGELENEPHVTRLDQPSSVTLGADGATFEPTVGPAASGGVASGRAGFGGAGSGRLTEAALTRNGGRAGSVRWSQSKEEVVVSVPVAAGTRAKQVAVEIEERRLSVAVGVLPTRAVALAGRLKYSVSDEDDDTEAAWELCDGPAGEGGERLVRVTLVKRSIPGAVLWWRCVMEGDAEIDVLAIPDRKSANSEAALATHRVWQEAEKAFKKDPTQGKAMQDL